MPGENIQDWSTTALDNGNSDTLINWLEGQARASVNNSARSMMAAHAKDRNLKNGSIVTTGTANAQAFVSGVGYTGTVPTDLRVLLKIGTGLSNSSGGTTLNMDSIGDVEIKNQQGGALVAGDLLADGYAEFCYDGTNWILLRGAVSSRVVTINTGPGGTPAIPGSSGSVGGGVFIGPTASGGGGTLTYTPSAGLAYAVIEVLGGGGGGGGAAGGDGSQLRQGGGGASGGYSRVILGAGAIGASKTVVVGVAGATGDASGGAGGAGGASMIGGETVTITIATPAVVTYTGHGLLAGQTIAFTTDGALPTGITANTRYWIMSPGLTEDAFQITAEQASTTAVNTTGSQSGIHKAWLALALGGSGGVHSGVSYGAGGAYAAMGSGDFVVPGVSGDNGSFSETSGILINTGHGADSVYGGGGGGGGPASGGSAAAGSNATGYGAGGGGATTAFIASASAGGAGSQGVVMIVEYLGA